MLSLPEHKGEKSGSLRILDFQKLPFKPKRMFWVQSVNAGEIRGAHGHYKDKQQLFCIKGEVLVNLYSSNGIESNRLREGDSCFMNNMVWAEQTYITGDDILLVLCSEEFDKKDYFYNRSEVYSEDILYCS
jgi:dTDP-4-dehydrorhamnose 3,5-epimerase-like enzyme